MKHALHLYFCTLTIYIYTYLSYFSEKIADRLVSCFRLFTLSSFVFKVNGFYINCCLFKFISTLGGLDDCCSPVRSALFNSGSISLFCLYPVMVYINTQNQSLTLHTKLLLKAYTLSDGTQSSGRFHSEVCQRPYLSYIHDTSVVERRSIRNTSTLTCNSNKALSSSGPTLLGKFYLLHTCA